LTGVYDLVGLLSTADGNRRASPKGKKMDSGTGYGGDTSSAGTSGSLAEAAAGAAQRQADADTSVTRLIAEIRMCLVCAQPFIQ